MRQYLYLLFLVILLCGCKKNEIVIPNETSTSLTINWKHGEFGNSSLKENARVYLYDSEKEYKNPVGKAILSKSLADIYPPDGGLITRVESASFDHLQPIKYWVKILNAYNNDRLIIDHNQDSSFVFQNPLIENTRTSVTISTKRIYVNTCTIQKIEIYDIPAGINTSIGEKISLTVLKVYPWWSADDIVLDSKIITINNSVITYEPTNAIMKNLNYTNYYIILNNVGSSTKEAYEINIFKLLNLNTYFGNEYIKLNDKNEIKYKLYVTWNFQEKI